MALDWLSHSVHVWKVPLSNAASAEDWRTLSEYECRRADRLVCPVQRAQWVQAKAWWRRILGHYLGRPPESIRVSVSAFGAPRVLPFISQSLSHTRSAAAIAVTEKSPIGIDIERIRNLPLASLIDAALTEAEARLVEKMPHDEKSQRFLRLWTRKEAWVKALGLGLSVPLKSFTVIGSESFQGDRMRLSRWTTTELPVGSEYVAALAYRDTIRSVSIHTVIPHRGEERRSVNAEERRQWK